MEGEEGTNLPPCAPCCHRGIGQRLYDQFLLLFEHRYGPWCRIRGRVEREQREGVQVTAYEISRTTILTVVGWVLCHTPFDGPVTGIPRYPVIDTDPHAFRVVRYFRNRDYATWGVVVAGFPGSMYLWGRIDPLRGMPKGAMRKIYGLSATVGLIGGFLMAYQDSSKRFWGWSENTREQELARIEIREKIAQGKPIYGTSDQPEHMQRVAVSNSRHSQLFFSIIPWFNFVNHPYHGDFAAKVASELTAEDK